MRLIFRAMTCLVLVFGLAPAPGKPAAVQPEQEFGQLAERLGFGGRRQRTFGNDDLDRHIEVSTNGFARRAGRCRRASRSLYNDRYDQNITIVILSMAI